MLEGTLESFTLPDIFQLLAFTKKSGCLRLERPGTGGRIYFRDGQVYYAVASHGRVALGRRLVGAGLVTTDALRAALTEQAALGADERGLRLGQILVSAGAITDDTLQDFVQEQIQDAVFDLMRWNDGSFSFATGAEPGVDVPIELSVSVENLIMEGARRLEEWGVVSSRIPHGSAVVALSGPTGASPIEVSLEPAEWRLLTLVDGRRTVGELVDLTGQGEFHTCKVLYGMLEAGLLEVRDGAGSAPSSIAALLEQQDLLQQLETDGEGADRTTVVGGPMADVDPSAPPVPPPSAPTPAPPPQTAPGPATADPAATTTPPDPQAADRAPRRPVDQPRARPAANVATPTRGGADRALTTDPAIDEDLVRRLIDGVKGLS